MNVCTIKSQCLLIISLLCAIPRITIAQQSQIYIPCNDIEPHLNAYLNLVAEDLEKREKALQGLSREQRRLAFDNIKKLRAQPQTPETLEQLAKLRGFASSEEDKNWRANWSKRMHELLVAWKQSDPGFFKLSPQQQKERYSQAIAIKQKEGSYPKRN